MNKPNFSQIIILLILTGAGILLPYLANSLNVNEILILMHIPVILAGFLLPMSWAVSCAVILPIANTLIFGIPTALTDLPLMVCELFAYAAFANFFYEMLEYGILKALLLTMLCGRVVLFCSASIYGAVDSGSFNSISYIVETFTVSWPGMILQIAAIPTIMSIAKKVRLRFHRL